MRALVLLSVIAVLAAAQGPMPPPGPPPEFCSMYMGQMEFLPPMPTPPSPFWDTPYEYYDWFIEDNEGWIEAPVSFAQEVVCDMYQYNMWTAAVEGPIFVLSPNRARVHAPYNFDFLITESECMFNVEGGLVQISRWDEFMGWLDIKWEMTFRDMGWGVTYVSYRAYVPPWTQWAMEEYMNTFSDCDAECVMEIMDQSLQLELGRIKTLVEEAYHMADDCMPPPPDDD